jgi:hypothetical protein
VPASRFATLPGIVGSDASIVGAVDAAGSVTVPFYLEYPLPSQRRLWIMLAVRRVAGAWQPLAVVTVHLDDPPLLLNFADADASGSGDVMIALKQHSAATGRTRLLALHYDAATALWQPPATPYADSEGPEQRARIAFGAGDEALASYVDFSGQATLSSRLFDGSVWAPGVVGMPGGPLANFHETAPDGVYYVMWFGDEQIFSSWLLTDAANEGE